MDIYLNLFLNTQVDFKFYKKNFDIFNKVYKNVGIKEIFFYTEKDLVLTENQKLFFNKFYLARGYGYWAWKPLVIRQSMDKIKDKDIVLYHDVGRYMYPYQIEHNINPFAEEIVKRYQGIGIATSGWRHINYCKRDAFVYMKCDDKSYWDLQHICATWSLWEKNDLVLKFIDEWIEYAFHEKEIITDCKNKCGLENFPEFIDHRHDQALLTNLIYFYKNNIDEKIETLPLITGTWEKNINAHLKKYDL